MADRNRFVVTESYRLKAIAGDDVHYAGDAEYFADGHAEYSFCGYEFRNVDDFAAFLAIWKGLTEPFQIVEYNRYTRAVHRVIYG